LPKPVNASRSGRIWFPDDGVVTVDAVAQHQLNLLAVVRPAVCWCAFVVTWLAAENYNESRAPAERQRSWFGTAFCPA